MARPPRQWIAETCKHDGEVGRCPMCRIEEERLATLPTAPFDAKAAAAGDDRDDD